MMDIPMGLQLLTTLLIMAQLAMTWLGMRYKGQRFSTVRMSVTVAATALAATEFLLVPHAASAIIILILQILICIDTYISMKR